MVRPDHFERCPQRGEEISRPIYSGSRRTLARGSVNNCFSCCTFFRFCLNSLTTLAKRVVATCGIRWPDKALENTQSCFLLRACSERGRVQSNSFFCSSTLKGRLESQVGV